MASDLIYPSSSPPGADAIQIPFPKRLQFYEADGTDDEVSSDRRDEALFTGESRKYWDKVIMI